LRSLESKMKMYVSCLLLEIFTPDTNTIYRSLVLMEEQYDKFNRHWLHLFSSDTQEELNIALRGCEILENEICVGALVKKFCTSNRPQVLQEEIGDWRGSHPPAVAVQPGILAAVDGLGREGEAPVSGVGRPADVEGGIPVQQNIGGKRGQSSAKQTLKCFFKQ
jgi:hypothetical protein